MFCCVRLRRAQRWKDCRGWLAAFFNTARGAHMTERGAVSPSPSRRSAISSTDGDSKRGRRGRGAVPSLRSRRPSHVNVKEDPETCPNRAPEKHVKHTPRQQQQQCVNVACGRGAPPLSGQHIGFCRFRQGSFPLPTTHFPLVSPRPGPARSGCEAARLRARRDSRPAAQRCALPARLLHRTARFPQTSAAHEWHAEQVRARVSWRDAGVAAT